MQNLCRSHHTEKTRENVENHGKDVNQHGKATAEGIERVVNMVLSEGDWWEPAAGSDEDRKKIGLFLKENKLKHSIFIFPNYLGNAEAQEKYLMKQIRPKGNILE